MATTVTTAAPATTVSGSTITLYPTTDKELVRNEIIIGAGITLLGGAIGFGYGLWKNSQAKRYGGTAIESDFAAAFEGALVGVIIALIAVLLYRAFFHSQAVYHQAKATQQAAVARYSTAQLQNYQTLAPLGAGLNVQGLQTAGRVGVGPFSNPALGVTYA